MRLYLVYWIPRRNRLQIEKHRFCFSNVVDKLSIWIYTKNVTCFCIDCTFAVNSIFCKRERSHCRPLSVSDLLEKYHSCVKATKHRVVCSIYTTVQPQRSVTRSSNSVVFFPHPFSALFHEHDVECVFHRLENRHPLAIFRMSKERRILPPKPPHLGQAAVWSSAHPTKRRAKSVWVRGAIPRRFLSLAVWITKPT